MTSARKLFLVGAWCTLTVALAAVMGPGALAEQRGEMPGVFTGETPSSASQLFEFRRASSDPHSFSVGSFLVRPSLDIALAGGYDDNVFAGSSNGQSDGSIEIHPEMRLLSQWARHSLEIIVGGDTRFHKDFSSENQINGYAGVSGTIDVRNGLTVAANIRYRVDHEERGEGESFPLFDKPILYHSLDGGITVNKRFNRMSVQLGVSARYDDFEDTVLLGPGPAVAVDQDFRDGPVYVGTARVTYEFSPLTSFFVQYAHDWRDYTGSAFDSNGYNLSGGVVYEFSRLVRGEFSAGVIGQGFDVTSRKDINTYTFDGSIVWDPTEHVDVSFVANRRISGPSGFAGASSRINSEVGARFDYEIWTNLSFSAALSFGWVEFVDTGREDTIVKGQIGARYVFNDRVSTFATYTYTSYDGNSLPVSDYDRDRLQAGFSIKLF